MKSKTAFPFRFTFDFQRDINIALEKIFDVKHFYRDKRNGEQRKRKRESQNSEQNAEKKLNGDDWHSREINDFLLKWLIIFMKNAAVFFDKDGTLIKNVPYNVRPELIELNDGAAEAVRLLKNAGFRLFVVSNQSGVGRGFFVANDLAAVWAKINELCGVEFDGFYFCPHTPNDFCDCRKPQAGMLIRAAQENRLDLDKSWLVGDALSDAEAGARAGCKTILLDDEYEINRVLNAQKQPDFKVHNLREAAEIILRNEQSES